MYSSGIASETCTYNDKWVGLPVEVDFNVLYVNEEILKNYQEVPTTWNELIDTAEYILKEDRKKILILIYQHIMDYLIYHQECVLYTK
ncbi:hypothetical protein BCR36DRAFT_455467 [Piromyces finnis]|uniref:Periplasmic binding protein-like II n=1 Tax=Piromyces finnis TaxID=1754191 RepID=A0A1Y1V4C0_9FUNG|nr:hypothetical protein BCR36DRAFT_455467 [Piromyces finnis]|eukprot:ORX46949.1 hypothetical protein BCR36DRAFT_455467 [Piromyces finnis]